MSQKSEFRFEFPKLGTEYKALANSAHIEQVTAIVMGEHDTDLCIVWWDETLLFICRYENKRKQGERCFKFFYEDKSKPQSTRLICDADIVEYYKENGRDTEAAKKTVEQYGVFPDYLTERTFHSENEVNAYVLGVDDAMSMTGNEDNYCFLSEEEYSIFYNKATE